MTLTTPVPIDITQELWIGYNIDSPIGFPAGADDGPAIDGYGNMINFGGWQTLLQINPDLDYNWNISAHLVTVAGVSLPLSRADREIAGYNVYRNAGGAGYVLMDYISGPFIEPAEGLIPGTMYCYMVTAVWMSETDQCESDFSNEACVLWTNIHDQDATISSFRLYPNPAVDNVTITTSCDMKRIKVYNALGQPVIDEVITGRQYKLSTVACNIGAYMVQVESAEGITTRTLTIQR